MKQKERKHLAIIAAAKDEFIAHGFIAANMDRISTSAEVSKRTLYRHFDSKEALFVSVLRIIQESVAETAQYDFNPDRPLAEQLTEITRCEVDIVYNTYGIALSRTIVMEFLRQPELAQNLVNELYSTRSVSSWFEQAVSAGCLIDKDIRLITSIYMSLFQGLLFWPQVMNVFPNSEGELLNQQIDTIVSIFLKAFEVNPLEGK